MMIHNWVKAELVKNLQDTPTKQKWWKFWKKLEVRKPFTFDNMSIALCYFGEPANIDRKTLAKKYIKKSLPLKSVISLYNIFFEYVDVNEFSNISGIYNTIALIKRYDDDYVYIVATKSLPNTTLVPEDVIYFNIGYDTRYACKISF
jgi:hypothetical protein